MSGQKEDRHLIHHLSGREAPARHRVRRGHDLGRQIVGGGARGDPGGAFLHQLRDQPPDHGGGAPGPPPVPARHPSGQANHRGKVYDGLGILMGAKGGKHLGRDPVLDGDREKGAEDRVGGGMARLWLDVDLLPGAGGEALGGGQRGGPDGGKGLAQAAALEGGVDDAALAFPQRAIGDKDRLAQQGRQTLAQAARVGGFG